MATTKIWPVRGWIGQAVHYVENKEKTAGTCIYRKSRCERAKTEKQ